MQSALHLIFTVPFLLLLSPNIQFSIVFTRSHSTFIPQNKIDIAPVLNMLNINTAYFEFCYFYGVFVGDFVSIYNNKGIA